MKGAIAMPASEQDAVTAYVGQYLDSVESGTPRPDPARMSADELAEAEAILDALGDPSDETADVVVPPIEESVFAVARGIARTPPAVVVDGDAVRHFREEAGLSIEDVASAMSAEGFTSDAARIRSIEDRAATPLGAREARRLAATVDADVASIETRCEPWPVSEQAEFDAIAGDVRSVRFGEALAFVAEGDTPIGIMRCHCSAEGLDSLTVRRAAADLLHGEWSALHGVALVSAAAPHLVVVLDPFDCDARFAAPTGERGYAFIEPASTVAAAAADFNLRFGIEWDEPPIYAMTEDIEWTDLIDTAHVGAAVANLRKNLNRLREPRRSGVRAALESIDASSADEINVAGRALVDADPDTAATVIATLAGVG